ncbi:3-hydroxyacyl-CoA dehydrogenase NAD-binding domain-containing protein [Neptunicoccus cionae]|uniref:3-hydroxyacyl-CoA dehydrogenase n=1 Tax=Neptunicoccus cionae TaxID=2035344 RepID=A0A916QVY8_9RHOB|nr:3-hydroxyacyl-CoA dehydrogenase NAD-binding domain-containing protein [Amylibacter cionae]GGA15124.1 3-hydroxyacyl-CoA dehydrogenase [Amylibacter cionae]
MTDFHYKLDDDGIAIITWDCPDKSMNIMSETGFAELNGHIDTVLGDDAIKGAIITSGKDSFAAGMDLTVLAEWKEKGGDTPARALMDGVMQGHEVMRKIERAGMDPKTNKGGKPIVAALPGTGLGIGLEIPLACHRIFVADNPKAKIGLPEIMVGIFPGGGGTTRLVRKLGVMNASSFLLEGKTVAPAKAKAAGLIDEVVPADELISSAKAWIESATDADLVKPWDAKGYKMPGGTPYHPAGFMTFVGATAMVHGKTQGAFPAAKAMLAAVYEGALVPFDQAIRIEARWFTNILLNPSSSAMINSLFINKGALEKGAVRPKGIPDQSVKKVGVLGAGMMGAGIALVSALAGIEVVLIDQSQEAADKGKAYSEAHADKGIARKKSTPEKKEKLLSLITATTDLEALKGCDLIVEAVFEDVGVKAEMTKKVEAIVGEDCIFATNTSTLPISELAKASARPEQFIGIHFFSPVDKMLLVEIIKGKETGDRAVAKSLDFVRQIRKTPIVVNDERFFYANRCIIPYGAEANRMVAEGVEPALIENAAKQLGFPLGPLQLGDETSIDLAEKIMRATKAALGNAYPASNGDDVVQKLFDMGRLGRKTKSGFYDYDEKGKRTGLWKGLGDHFPVSEDQPSLTDVQHRLAMAQVLEAVRALEEGVLEDIREGDVGAILGWGFMPWSGGPFSWLDILGSQKAVEICEDLAARYGDRFEPPALLKEMAKNGESFYGRFGADAKAA